MNHVKRRKPENDTGAERPWQANWTTKWFGFGDGDANIVQSYINFKRPSLKARDFSPVG